MSIFKQGPLTPASTTLGILEENVTGIGVRWHDAWGDVQKVILTPSEGVAPLTLTVVGTTPTAVPSVTSGELITIATSAEDFAGINAQVKGALVKCEAGKPFKAYCEIKLSEATQSDFLFGLCGVKTDLLATSSAHAINSAVEGLFFCKLDNTTTINCHGYLAGTQTNVAVAGTMGVVAREYEIDWDGTLATFFLDGVKVATFSASLPTVSLTLSLNCRAGSAAINTFTIYPGLRVIQARS